MLPFVCLVIHQRWLQNVVTIKKVDRDERLPSVSLIFSQNFKIFRDVFCIYRSNAIWNIFVLQDEKPFMRPLTDFSVVEHRSAESGGMKFDPFGGRFGYDCESDKALNLLSGSTWMRVWFTAFLRRQLPVSRRKFQPGEIRKLRIHK